MTLTLLRAFLSNTVGKLTKADHLVMYVSAEWLKQAARNTQEEE